MARRHVAVIDNDPALQRLLGEALSDEGYVVDGWDLREDPLELVLRREVSAIILNLRLGVPETGAQLLQRLRQHDATRHIPVIICSADVAALRAQSALFIQLNCQVIEKPFDLDDMSQAIELAMSQTPPTSTMSAPGLTTE